MEKNDVLEVIKGRRSIRKFKKQEVPAKVIEGALESARWAPSGLNNQPWRFKVAEGAEKDSLAAYTKYGRVINEADKLILFFLDKESLYNYEKDLMAAGAGIENALLYLHAAGYGSCWLGEIVNQAGAVEKKLSLSPDLKFIAAVAVGTALNAPCQKRKPLDTLLLE